MLRLLPLINEIRKSIPVYNHKIKLAKRLFSNNLLKEEKIDMVQSKILLLFYGNFIGFNKDGYLEVNNNFTSCKYPLRVQ